ncbi:hypothetical protein [Sporosarcina sp. FSL K6-2383]|uniref:hypothetical protein n=1 Tax=Sporosarcina sp. FSL K6-2383 TaxID=2921556 RepID=UPI00315A9116
MRRVRGTKALVEYLVSIGCPMSEATIYKLLREKRIPAIRPAIVSYFLTWMQLIDGLL